MNPKSLAAILTLWNPDGSQQISLMPASRLVDAHCPPFPTSEGAILHSLIPAQVRNIKDVLLTIYPASHPLQLASCLESDSPLRQDLVLGELDTVTGQQHGEMAVWVPSLGADTSFEAFQEIIGHLRAPDGCPWDRKQTHQTLRMHLLGEAYETLAAMDANDPREMAEEFGDLLLQIVLNAQIASETGDFNMALILQGIHRKIVRRHPHVFGEVTVEGVGDVLSNWEAIKAEERSAAQAANGQEKPKGLLDGVPEIFPSLAQAQEIQDRAARVGFDWPDIRPVIDRVLEELDELQQAETPEDQEAELGDLLFAAVNVGRWLKVDAESALRSTNQRFRRRFGYVEEQARKAGRVMSTMTLDEMDAFWDEAKSLGM